MTTAIRSSPVATTTRTRRRDAYAHLYTQLAKRVRDSGLLRRRYAYYWSVMSLTVLALAGVVAGLVLLGDSWFQLLLAVPLAVIFGQLAFIGHDAAHRQIFWSHRANDWAGLIHGTLLGGLSAGWWMPKHNRHHANPNKQDTDPDVAPGLVAFTRGGAFAPNHIGMPIVPPDLKLDFLRRQVLMSRNVTGGRIQPIVRHYCATHNIPYTEQTSSPPTKPSSPTSTTSD